MRYIRLDTTDPAFNLAAEEWLLRHAPTDVFMLWRNAKAVIVGRNQNTRAQIDEDFVRDHNIPVVRRLSGGGAVFHDLGNINFTFICTGNAGHTLDFRRFTTPIIEALAAMGVACDFEGRNDLVINGQKISGNAQHIWQDRVLHHGTLLFSADVADISGALRIDPAKYQDKAVKSIQKRVTNIAAHLLVPMDAATFMARLMTTISGGLATGDLALTPEEQADIEALAADKYRTFAWNYGQSPSYALTRTTRTPGGLVEAHLEAASGTITGIRLLGDFFGRRDIAELEAQLLGCRHDRQALTARLEALPLCEYMLGVDAPTLANCLF